MLSNPTVAIAFPSGEDGDKSPAVKVDEESILVCTRGNLLIRHSQARATFPAGEGRKLKPHLRRRGRDCKC